MTLSDLIEMLEALRDRYGDVWAENAGGGSLYREDVNVVRDDDGDVVAVAIGPGGE